MTVKANWYVTDLLADAAGDDDPSDGRVEDLGKPIDLDTDEPRLVQRVEELVDAERKLYNLGVTCELKYRSGVSCSACPLATPFSGTPRGRLCQISREQERVLTLLAISRHGNTAA